MTKARFLAPQARDPAPQSEHSKIGYNYRMSNILAAIGRGQLKVLDERVARARTIFQTYYKRLNGLPGIGFMPEPAWSHGNRWLTCITVNPEQSGVTGEAIRLHLEKHQIESRPLWKPMHMQPVFKGCSIVGGEVSQTLFKTGLCLPSGTSLSEEDLDRICGLIVSFIREKQKGPVHTGGV